MIGTQIVTRYRDRPTDLITGSRPFDLYDYDELFARAREIGLPESEIDNWAEDIRLVNETLASFERFLDEYALEQRLEAERT